MQARRIVILFLFLTLLNRFHVCFAQEEKIDADTQSDIKQQILELEERVREMERQHAIEIRELNEKVQALSRELQEKAEEDAMADLRRQAEADAAKEEPEEEPEPLQDVEHEQRIASVRRALDQRLVHRIDLRHIGELHQPVGGQHRVGRRLAGEGARLGQLVLVVGEDEIR